MSASLTYCVVPAGTDPGVVETLRRHYAADPTIKVVIDSRNGGRDPGPVPGIRDVRRKPVLRRSTGAIPVSVPGVRFEQHLPPVGAVLADQPLQVVVTMAAQHDPAASAELRWRLHQTVHALVASRMGTQAAAVKKVPAVLDTIQDQLGSYPPDEEFHVWLAQVVDQVPLTAA
jgi:hypothetical protein